MRGIIVDQRNHYVYVQENQRVVRKYRYQHELMFDQEFGTSFWWGHYFYPNIQMDFFVWESPKARYLFGANLLKR